jgi:mannan endo-1,4-beta-mannosidase
VALGEVGKVPSPDVLNRQTGWVWFMVWSDFLDKENTHEDIRSLYASPRVISREDLSEAL